MGLRGVLGQVLEGLGIYQIGIFDLWQKCSMLFVDFFEAPGQIQILVVGCRLQVLVFYLSAKKAAFFVCLFV